MELNDDRYFGSHFPIIGPKARKLIGIVVIRDFRESDLQNNFTCFQYFDNGTLLAYPLSTESPYDPANSFDYKVFPLSVMSVLFVMSLSLNALICIVCTFCKTHVFNFIIYMNKKLRNFPENTETNTDTSTPPQPQTPQFNSPLHSLFREIQLILKKKMIQENQQPCF